MGKEYLKKKLDSKKKFGRELFSYYESIKEYIQLSKLILQLMHRERKLVSNNRFSKGTVTKIQELSDELDKFVSVLTRTFEEEWSDKIRKKRRNTSSEKMGSRHNVLEVYDKPLSDLVSLANSMDMNVSYLMSRIGEQKIDWQSQTIVLLPPEPDLFINAIEEIWNESQFRDSRDTVYHHYMRLNLNSEVDFNIITKMVEKI